MKLLPLITFLFSVNSYACKLQVKNILTKEVKYYVPDEYPFNINLPKSDWKCGVHKHVIKKRNNFTYYDIKCKLGHIFVDSGPNVESQLGTSMRLGQVNKGIGYSIQIKNCNHN